MTTPKHIQSADLVIETDTGQVSALANNTSGKLRLSPVNRRVLLNLLRAEGEVVKRQQLFDAVWPNQEISDDALSRSISDLRSQLKTLSNETTLIETVPKVGYRWLHDIAEFQSHSSQKKRWFHWPTFFLALGITLLISFALVGWIQYRAKQQAQVTNIIILDSTPAGSPNWKNCLKQATQKHKNIQYLSDHASSSHIGNPYPYFSQEFRIKWFIESTYDQKTNNLQINLVDARTGLVIYEYPISDAKKIQTTHCQMLMQKLSDF